MLKTPIIDVVGYKDSGKTSIIEKIVRRITDQGYRVFVIKHVHDPNFSFDTPGKDSWRIAQAGAKMVALISGTRRVIMENAEFREEDLSRLLEFGGDSDLIILEGFKSTEPSDLDIYYILAARNEKDISALSKKRSNIIFVNKPAALENTSTPGVLSGNLIMNGKTAKTFIDKTIVPMIVAGKIWKTLPNLDCTECGYKTCKEMAIALAKKENRNARCVVECTPPKLRVQVGESRIAMKRFVQDIIRSSILAMISTLKGASISGEENVTIIIEKEK